MAEAKDIKEKVLWVIDTYEDEKRGGGTDLRVVQWLINGKPTKPNLEKREFYFDKEGERKIGKAKGMSSFDLAKIIINVKRIAKLLEMKADALDEALQLAMFQDDKTPAPDQTPRSKTPTATGAGAPPAQTF